MFHETRFLDCVKFGSTGGPTFNTTVVSALSGFEFRNGNWSIARHRYEIGMSARIQSEFMAIKSTYMLCFGRLYGFRWKDAADYETIDADGSLLGLLSGVEVGDQREGYGIPVYRIYKKYTVGSLTTYRRIIKLVDGTVVIRRNASPVTVGASPGNIAIDTATGLVTFVADQSRAISAHTPGASHVFTLASAFSPNLAAGGRIYVSGITGTAATALNGISHEISNVAGADITVTTNTTALTASGGNAYFYPQPTEALSASFEFDVPVRFDTDEFNGVILDRNGANGELIIELPSVALVELKDGQ
jgi:uncharacterized protein (TIGR02217 family)